MVKNKRNFVQLPKKTKNSNVEKEDSDLEDVTVSGRDDVAEGYDSMIENGTSDDSDASMDNDDVESDDGFSEKESEKEEKPQPTKRKLKQSRETNKKLKSDENDNQHLFKQPTVEEINQLKETENLFHSNLFRLQIREMLKEIKVKEKYPRYVETWVENFANFLNDLKSSKTKEDSDKISWLQKSEIHVPICLEKLQSTKFQFQFIKPSEKPFVIGSSQTKTLIGPQLVVDVGVAMPESCFQKENYLNLIYDQKRALYLSYIAWNMSKKQFGGVVKFNYYRNNPLKPILEITPSENVGKKLLLRIFVTPAENAFKLNRFVPWNSNIRGSLFGEKTEDETPLATPNYNANVLFDLTMKRNQQLIDEVIGTNKNLQEGLILLKIWLKQRSLDDGYSGFGNYVMTMLVVYLFRQRKLHVSMSSYQIARNVWNNIAMSNWNVEGKGITLCNNFSAANQPTLDQFSAYYDVVFVDSTGFMNLCSNLSLDVYFKLKLESARAVELLNNTKLNSFQALFMVKYPMYTQCDHIMRFNKSIAIDRVLTQFGQRADQHSYAGFWYPHLNKLFTAILRKGLGDRIISIVPIESSTCSWDITETPKQLDKSFQLGLSLNPESALQILDKGPQANESTAQAFRDFWGEKSDLRRFQDGSITEACVWASASDPLSQKRLIVRKIVEHLLNHHFKVKPIEISYIAAEFDIAYQMNRSLRTDSFNQDAESTSVAVIKTFDELGKHLRSLENLPLDITGIQGISPVFRYCDPEPSTAQSKIINDKFHAHKIHRGVIQLGMSGKWPSEIGALRALKTAFYIQIAQALRVKYNLPTKPTVSGILVMKNGFLYCIEISHQKEVSLLKKTVSERGLIQYSDTSESLAIDKHLNIMPKVTSALHGLHQQYPAYGPSVMIAKRWIYSQLIDRTLWPDDCTELLIASQFLKHSSLLNPSQPQVGFFRFLQLLAKADWKAEMILLNFNDELSGDEISELENRFASERESFPTLFITTSFDMKKYGIWSQTAPSVQVLNRVCVLARYALSVLEPVLTSSKGRFKLEELFLPSLNGYDVIIHLNPKVIQPSFAHDFTPITMGQNIVADKSKKEVVPLAGYNPVECALHELREAYSDFAIFFHNPCGGKQIAVIWKPEIFTEKEFKVTSVNGCTLTEQNTIKYNTEAILEDFKIILKGLCITLDTRRK